MKLHRSKILLLCLAAGMWAIFFAACCKKQESTTLQLEFTDFDFEQLDSVQLITTDRSDFSDTLDIAWFDLERNHFINIPVYFDQFHNHSYIVNNSDPLFQYKISHVVANYSEERGCDELLFSFQINGDSYLARTSHRLLIDTAGIVR